MANRKDLKVDLKIEYIPLLKEHIEAWRASLLMLVDWLIDDLMLHPEIDNEPSEQEIIHAY